MFLLLFIYSDSLQHFTMFQEKLLIKFLFMDNCVITDELQKLK